AARAPRVRRSGRSRRCAWDPPGAAGRGERGRGRWVGSGDQPVTAGVVVTAWAAAAVAARTSDGAAVDAVVVGSDGWATISITAIAVGTISEQLTSSRLVRSSGSTTVLVTGAG